MRNGIGAGRRIGTTMALLVALPLAAHAATIQISTNGYSGEYALNFAGGPQITDYANGGNASPDLEAI